MKSIKMNMGWWCTAHTRLQSDLTKLLREGSSLERVHTAAKQDRFVRFERHFFFELLDFLQFLSNFSEVLH